MISEALINLIVGLLVLALVVIVFWPQTGLIARFRKVRSASYRMISEDLLKAILKTETEGRSASIDELAGTTDAGRDRVTEVLTEMSDAELVTLTEGIPQLTDRGREGALHIVRAHRIWERHLADRTGVAEADWHDEAELVEHRLSPQDLRQLYVELGHPTTDPHGDPIPAEGAELPVTPGIPMSSLEPGDRGRIVHVEDEPPIVYAQLVAEGLSPGMTIQMLEKSGDRIRFWADGSEIVLAHILAVNVTVSVIERNVAERPQDSRKLVDARPGDTVRVTGISPRCRGPMRRRLLDLGVVPGTMITVEREAPGGDPVAYRIRGAIIALREAQAELIQVEKENAEAVA